MRIAKNISDLIGKTPLLEVRNLEKAHQTKARVLAKLESFNPAGSAKDRVAVSMINDAEKRGLLRPGGTIIEPTSGNTGVGLAAIGASRGYRVILTMPETMSIERRNLLKAYGAQVILTEGKKGMKGAIEKAEALQKEIPGSLITGQFVNPANPAAHIETTGPEIWEQTEGKVDVFVAGVGTGGTLTGVGTFLRQKNPSVRLIAVEPADSPVLSGGMAGPHGIQGIGAGFVPKVLNTELYDEVIGVTTAQAYAFGREMARSEGILVGISSGAAMYAAVEIAKRSEYADKTVVVFLPDTGERYLSTAMFDD